MVETGRQGRWQQTVFLVIALVACGAAAAAQDSPVSVSVVVSGDAVPGGTVVASATVDIQDGSEIQGLHWMQVSGADAMLSGVDTDTVTAVLNTLPAYKDQLIHALSEPGISEDQLPPNVPLPEGEFPGGLQNRFQVVGINPLALEHAGAVVLEIEVTTTSGTYHGEAEIHTALPWSPTAGIHNVPIDVPVLLHGKEQDYYSWRLGRPADSSAAFDDASSQSPSFVPDVSGRYWMYANDDESGEQVTMSIFAGTWQGIVEGQDEDGRPLVDQSCYGCHNDEIAPEVFSDWRQTGHAEILTNNLNTSTHYGPNCFPCHAVGFNHGSDNGGMDDASDYQDFLDSGLINNPGDNWTTMLDEFPHTAKLSNIQCENCHGPQQGGGHTQEGMRSSLASDVCATCHGEPLRHARFQQWQLSAHANYELAIEEGSSGSCSRCHTGNGFLTWLPVLLGDEPGDPTDSIEVTWTEDDVHPQTCQTCHDPHAIGTTSGSDPNATVRISGDTPPLIAGFTATDVGRGAICMTCHNTRRGLRNDDNYDEIDGTSEAARAPHGGAQADVVMGQNAYMVEVGTRGKHSNVEDACVACHMEATPPPPDLSYNSGGTNHTFYARNDICGSCHGFESGESFQAEFEDSMHELQELVEEGHYNLMSDQIDAGNTIDLDGDAMIDSMADVAGIEFSETRGRQAITVVFGNGETVGPMRLTDIDVVPTTGDPVGLYEVAEPILLKSGWNYLLFHNDGSRGVHNPSFATNTVEVSKTEIVEAGIAVGGGEGPGGVACDADFVYWTEIAAHNVGAAGSRWRTDLVARNAGEAAAELDLILRTKSGARMVEGIVGAGAQMAFEDIVGMMDFAGKGSLQICSSQPLEVLSRVYNQSDDGTFGTLVDGFMDGSGLSAGESARLIGLRQLSRAFRTNISVTNTGSSTARVAVTLFAENGDNLHDYTLWVSAGMVVQDLQPFANRAGEPDLGWGFALVEVVEGEGVLASATVVDSKTNDGISVPMK